MLSRRSLLLAASTVAPALAVGAQPFDAAAFADAQRAGRPILVAIDASWCPI